MSQNKDETILKGTSGDKSDKYDYISGIKSSISQIFDFLVERPKLIFILGSRTEDIKQREIEFEKTRSQRNFIARLKAPLTIFGLIIIFFVISMAVFAPWISKYTELEMHNLYSGSWAGPSAEHPLGTSDFGRDILARLIYGARTSITISLPAIFLSVIVGTIIGVISAYFGGIVDNIIMFITDVMLAFPGIVLAMVLVSITGTSNVQDFILVFGILGISGYIRLIRGSVLQARELTYVEAAIVSGSSHLRIMFKHILPNVISVVLITFTFQIGGFILSLAGLGFLGFGDPYIIEWGNDIATARTNLYDAPHASFWPGMMILITVLGFMLVGDGIRDALDPRLKNL